MTQKVVTRFAPSPTGNLNLGGVRAGIFAWLFARHNGGKFIVRIEDTDKERSKKEFENNILESLTWLDIDIDETYRQSEHVARHEELLRKLVADDKAYVSKEDLKATPSRAKESPLRQEVIRFRNPNKKVTFFDCVHGQIEFDTTELKDFVIAKSFTEPIFHFALVADDWDEGVTHVVRGEDHISNTPRQILIQEALGAPRPEYAHLPLVMGSDHSKLSKRKGAKAITEYREAGYLPEAILNYDAFLGWHPEGDEEIFTKEELVRIFTLDRVQKNPAMFDETKLLWFNAQHLKRLADDEYAKRLREFCRGRSSASAEDRPLQEFDARLVPLIKERAQTLEEAAQLLLEYDFLGSVSPDAKLLTQGGKLSAPNTSTHLQHVQEMLSRLSDEDFTPDGIKNALWPYAEAEGRGAVLWPLRTALSGRERSPDPFTIAALLRREETLARIVRAVSVL